jgi:cytoskeleton protein RodZ
MLEAWETVMKKLGRALKAERLRRGLTLREASEHSHISVSILRALEQGQFERIGPPTVVRGLLTDYRLALGIAEEAPKGELLTPDREAEKQDATETTAEVPEPCPAPSGNKQLRPMLVGFLLGMVFMGSILGAVRHFDMRGALVRFEPATVQTPEEEKDFSAVTEHNGSRTEPVGNPEPEAEPAQNKPPLEETPPPPQPPVPEETLSLEGQPAAEPERSGTESGRTEEPAIVVPQSTDEAPEVSATRTEAEETQALPATVSNDEVDLHQFEMEADQKTWVRIFVDGKRTESALLTPGEKREWKVRKYVKLVVGNAGGVSMKWDGEPVRISAKSGRVVRLTLPDGYKARD